MGAIGNSGSWLARRAKTGLTAGFARAFAQLEADPERVLAELQRGHRLQIHSISEMLAQPLERVDAIAEESISAALKMAALEGAGFGMFGIFAIVPDTAVLAGILVRMLGRLSLIYGFNISTDAERAEMWLAAASAVGLDLTKEWIEKQVLERLAPRVMAKISERLGIEVAERAAGKLVPLLSSALGAGLNYWLVKSWGRRLQKHFRQKHIIARRQLALA
jgi:hypothetical protein